MIQWVKHLMENMQTLLQVSRTHVKPCTCDPSISSATREEETGQTPEPPSSDSPPDAPMRKETHPQWVQQ